MTVKELIKIAQDTFTACEATLVAKNHDYSRGDDGLRNFKLCENMQLAEAENGIMVRLCDKFARIANLLHADSKVKSESIEDTIDDAINYFVKMGGGIVFFHASSTAFYHWTEFHQMAGGTWRDNVTRHGRPNTFEVKISDIDHPITRGMKGFTTTDELWVNTVITGEPEIFATAFASAQNRGAEKDEPMVFCTHFGKGRGYYIALGHDVAAIENLGFQTLMLRGTEWAATNKVRIPIPNELRIADKSTSKQSSRGSTKKD